MKPNILIIVIDSLRADHVSCYGYHRKTTPNIDRLAAEGCLFETAITAAPFSPASYASIFSGLYPHQHGVNGDTVRIWPDTWPRLPELLRDRGYFTFCISNNSFVTQATNGARGFDAFVDLCEPRWYVRQHNRVLRRVRKYFGEHVAQVLSSNALQCTVKGDSARSADQAITLIEEAKTPFFGFLILMDPHTPYNKYRTAYSGRTAATRRFFRRRNNRTMWAELMAANSSLFAPEIDIVRDLYDAEVQHSDGCVGTLVTWLRDRGLIDDTVVVVTSDHGEAFGEHGVWGHGFCLNDCLTRVPLIVRHPTYWSPGTRCPRLVQLHDLHNLCLSVSVSGTPETVDHPGCLTQARDQDWPGREVVFSEFPRQSKTLRFMHNRNPRFAPGFWDQGMWAVRSLDWRYIEYDGGECELYDLRADPDETTSVNAKHQHMCEEFRVRLQSHRNDRPREQGTQEVQGEIDEVVVERLRALGYIE